MNRPSIVVIALALLLACRCFSVAAADAPPDDATKAKLAKKVDKLIDGLKLPDADKAAKAKAITSDWLGAMLAWHAQHDAELKTLWGDWNKARAVVPKDEFPGEVIAHKIDDVYASLKPAYDDYISKISAELTPEQLDQLKETWSRSPGMKRTYTAYVDAVPDLTDADKQIIHDHLARAREAAMLTDSDKEIVAIYKRHKVKVEQYIGGLQWTKLHHAYAEKGKREAEAKKEKAAASGTPSGK